MTVFEKLLLQLLVNIFRWIMVNYSRRAERAEEWVEFTNVFIDGLDKIKTKRTE